MIKIDIKDIKSQLQDSKKIIVIPHKNPDGDAIGSCVALNELLKLLGHKSLNISPNPSNGNFAINFNDSFDNAAMTITNMMGSVVYSEALFSVSNSTQNFDLDLNSGVYLVKVADDANEFTTRVVIK